MNLSGRSCRAQTLFKSLCTHEPAWFRILWSGVRSQASVAHSLHSLSIFLCFALPKGRDLILLMAVSQSTENSDWDREGRCSMVPHSWEELVTPTPNRGQGALFTEMRELVLRFEGCCLGQGLCTGNTQGAAYIDLGLLRRLFGVVLYFARTPGGPTDKPSSRFFWDTRSD